MGCVPTENGAGESDIYAAASGSIKAMLISNENPAGVPDAHRASAAREALSTLDFLVVHDLFLTETAQLADVVLPATTWTEVSGTMTNVDRHVQLLRPAIIPIGESRSLWDALNDLAGLMGHDLGYGDAADVFDAITVAVPAYAGLSHQRLDWEGAMQWPVRTVDDTGTPILFTDRFATASGRAQMVTVRRARSAGAVRCDCIWPDPDDKSWAGSAMARRFTPCQLSRLTWFSQRVISRFIPMMRNDETS